MTGDLTMVHSASVSVDTVTSSSSYDPEQDEQVRCASLEDTVCLPLQDEKEHEVAASYGWLHN